MEDAWLAEKEQRDSVHVEATSCDRDIHLNEHPKCSRTEEPSRKRKRLVRGPKLALDKILDQPCPIHSVLLNTNPTHSLRAC
jgi:hypothetical protein